MTGYENFNFPAFDKSAEALRAAGHEVFNPADNDREKGYVFLEGDKVIGTGQSTMRDCIMDDLTYIAREAEAIAVLSGWEKSKGVAVEVALARFLSIPIVEMHSIIARFAHQED